MDRNKYLIKLSGMTKHGAVTDPVIKAVDSFLKSLSSAVQDRYTTLDEVGNFFNQQWKAFIDGLQANYERIYKQVQANPKAYGIEVLGGGDAEDVVNEHNMNQVDETQDQFQTPEEQQANTANVQDVFSDEDTGGGVLPQ